MEKKIYPDHYIFQKTKLKDFEEAKEKFKINCNWERYYKIRDFGINEISYLQVKLEIEEK